MKILRKIIEIDEELCDGCGQCVPGCAEGALQIVDGKARVVEDKYCDGLGACIGECPNGALKIIEREAEDFDEEAVEKYLAEKEKEAGKEESLMPCGCPSTQIQRFVPSESCQSENTPASIPRGEDSALSHWPVQIRLIPADAPFLRGADILVLADCVSVAFPALHRDLLRGKVVMMGCPKFDEVQEYINKFADIFKTASVKSVTTAVMEVPCCSGLPTIVQKGMEASGKILPIEEIVISTRGKMLNG
ncbi:ATP-binding protein [Desulfonema magnum]|uniref:4Fe-4S ferredoxin iron-sulfur binding domain-containing protein n=1 Tax=Desulfonema magnum TaxID=45655 RepID=A0A975GQD0_9BACT|nr:4Fe-4S binding protein [Desulfonema magnum]QTA89906.1 4Fe-4S ferredoxin iron-sulfur binding domain-containing protein [Desulfonema magnum]